MNEENRHSDSEFYFAGEISDEEIVQWQIYTQSTKIKTTKKMKPWSRLAHSCWSLSPVSVE